MASQDRVWLPFEEAREFVRGLGFSRVAEWVIFSSSGKRPENIPSSPNKIYAERGWVSFIDWIRHPDAPAVPKPIRVAAPKTRAKDRTPSRTGNFLNYKAAREIAHQLKLACRREWHVLATAKKLPEGVPANPVIVYGTDFLGWDDWLGHNTPTTNPRVMPFNHIRTYAQSLGLTTRAEWERHCASPKVPAGLTPTPEVDYPGDFAGWPDFLGSAYTGVAPAMHLPFTEARDYARSLRLKTFQAWQEHLASRRLPGIPARPDIVYADQWINTTDWLGKKPVISRGRALYLKFAHAREYARSLGLRTQEQWLSHMESGSSKNKARIHKPGYSVGMKVNPAADQLKRRIPAHPDTHYNTDWVSWEDWLGFTNEEIQARAQRSQEQVIRSLAKQIVDDVRDKGHLGRETLEDRVLLILQKAAPTLSQIPSVQTNLG